MSGKKEKAKRRQQGRSVPVEREKQVGYRSFIDWVLEVDWIQVGLVFCVLAIIALAVTGKPKPPLTLDCNHVENTSTWRCIEVKAVPR